jgi:hypothetical protein
MKYYKITQEEAGNMNDILGEEITVELDNNPIYKFTRIGGAKRSRKNLKNKRSRKSKSQKRRKTF